MQKHAFLSTELIYFRNALLPKNCLFSKLRGGFYLFYSFWYLVPNNWT